MGRGKFKGKPTGRRQFSTPEEMRMSRLLTSYIYTFMKFAVGSFFSSLYQFLRSITYVCDVTAIRMALTE